MTEKELQALHIVATHIRMGAIEGVYRAKSGHPGGSLSIADLLAVLYFKEMHVDPENPQMEKRDRFVLSKGHCAPAYYAALAHRGFFPTELLETLRQVGSILQGHPDMKHIPGVDMSSGSLGQGISAACGMAKAGKLLGKDYRVYTILGDGELEEGQVWEAAMFAGHYQLDNLCVLVDNNGLQIDGDIETVCSPMPIVDKFTAFRFNTIETDAHDMEAIAGAFACARAYKGKPTAIIARSIKGKGVSYMENNAGWHGMAPDDAQYVQAIGELRAALSAYEKE